MNRLRLPVVVLITAAGGLLAACEHNTPLEIEHSSTSTEARFTGGVMYGSGNRGNDSTATTTTTDATTENSGVMYGSGN